MHNGVINIIRKIKFENAKHNCSTIKGFVMLLLMLHPEIISKIGTCLDSRSRNACLAAAKCFSTIHHDILYHKVTIESKQKFFRLPSILKYIRKIKPRCNMLDIKISSLDVNKCHVWNGKHGILNIDLYVDKIGSFNIILKQCKSINNVLSYFTTQCVQKIDVWYAPRLEDNKFDIVGKDVTLEIYATNGLEHIKYLTDQLRYKTVNNLYLITDTWDLSGICMDIIKNINVSICTNSVISGNIKNIDKVHNLQTKTSSLKYLENYMKDEARFRERCQLRNLTIVLDATFVNSIPYLMEIIGMIPDTAKIRILITDFSVEKFSLALIKLCKLLEKIRRHTYVFYVSHDTYLVACALERIFQNVEKVIHGQVEFIEPSMHFESIRDIYSNIVNQSVKDAWCFLDL